MKKILSLLSLCAISMGFSGNLSASKAPAFTLTSSTGESVSLTDFSGKYVVLEWVNYDCPFVKKFYSVGKMQELQKEMAAKDVVWLSICSSAPGKQGYYSAEAINAKMESLKASPTAYLIDENGKVGKAYDAKTTPHMFVISPEGVVIYQGAIDSIKSFQSNDIDKAINYVELAVSEAMAGKEVSTPSTKAYGCGVKY